MAIDCKKCQFYFITWDKAHPYGCKPLGFKTNKSPSAEVLSASGIDCLKFLPKNKIDENKAKSKEQI